MAVSTAQEFLDLLAKSELLSAAKLEEARSAAGGQGDPKAAARELIRLNLLTKWQAGVLCGGNAKLKLGKYTLLEQIGTEDIGLVYLAEHAQMGRKVVIKTLSNKYTNNAEAVKRFLTEAQKIAALHHRNIIHLFDVSSEGDRYYIVLENAEGRDFKSLIAADGPLARDVAADYLLQAVDGLSHAHAKSLYHGDIKPENLMVDGSGQVKILNFGVARLVETADKPADAASDLAALGDVGTYLLTGKTGLGDRKSAPPGIESLCLKMSTSNAAERFSSADEAAVALKKWQAEQKSAAPTASAPKIGRTTAAPAIKAKAKPEPPQPKPKPPALARRAKDPAPPPEPEPVAEPAEERINIVIGGTTKTAVAEKKKAKKPAAAAAVAPAATAEAAPAGEEPAKAEPRKLPLGLLIGGGAGAGVLAMSLLVAVLCYFLFFRGSGQEVAQNEPVQEEPAEKDPDEDLKNPEIKVAEPEPEPVKEPDPPKPEPVPEPEPAKPEPVPVTPPVEPVKPDPPKEPVTPPAPKPQPAKNPFTALATTVDLPKPESGNTTPVPLGPLPVGKELFFIDLAGGDKAGSTGKLAFTMKNAKGGTAERDWEITMSGGDGGGTPVIANLAIDKDELKFSWTDKGVADPNSYQLRNCVLSARTGAFTHSLALRKPAEAAPLTVTLEKPMKIDFSFDNAPDPASIEAEIISLEGFPKHKFDPKASFEARKDGTDILVGNDKEEALILKVDSTMRKNVTITVTPYFRLSGQAKEAKYTNALWSQAVRGLTQQNAILFNAVDQANKNKNPTAAELQFKSQAEQNLAKLQVAMKQVEEVKTTHSAINNMGKIHFRVYYKAGDQQVDLVRSSAAPAAQPGK